MNKTYLENAAYKLKPLQDKISLTHFLLQYLQTENYTVIGSLENGYLQTTDYITSLDLAESGTITFHKQKAYETIEDAIRRLAQAKASIIFIGKDFAHCHPKQNQAFIIVDNPMSTMCRVLYECCQCYIQSWTFNTNNKCYYGPGTYICDGVEIGNNVHIDGNVFIYGGVKIGDNVTIKAGTVIGGDGYQHSMVNGTLLPWRHLAGVIIEDNVNIGSNVCIDKGLFVDTILQEGCHIDNLCHIAHSVSVGKNASIVAGCMIAGSVQIGEQAWISPSVTLANGAHIGENAYVGIGSVVLRAVEASGFVYGVPARVPKQFQESSKREVQ